MRRIVGFGLSVATAALGASRAMRVSLSALRGGLPPDLAAGLAAAGFFEASLAAAGFFFAPAVLRESVLEGFLATRFAGFPADVLAFEGFAFIGTLRQAGAIRARESAALYRPAQGASRFGPPLDDGNSRPVRAILRRRELAGRFFSSLARRGPLMNVLVTGTDGYLGSLLAPVLTQLGFDVTGVDTGYYRAGWLYNPAGAA